MSGKTLTGRLPAGRTNGLFTRLVAGFRHFFSQHHIGVAKSTHHHDDANDVLQNTFIKVFGNLKNFNGDSKLYSWMYRIATNEAITFMQQRAKKQGISNEEAQQKAINKLESDVFFDGDEIQLKLQKAIAILPEKQQIVFKMKYFEELKYEEISEILGTSVGALKVSLRDRYGRLPEPEILA